MSQEQEDLIVSLMVAQAEEAQKQAVELQRAFKKALADLPEAAIAAVEKIIVESAADATKELLAASAAAKKSVKALGREWILQGAFLLGVTVVIAVGLHFAVDYVLGGRIEKLAQIDWEIKEKEADLAKIKTWGIKLEAFNDGTRGIVLPKGVKVDRTGPMKDGSGQIGIVITP